MIAPTQDDPPEAHDPAEPGTQDLGLGLQLSRASMMALTRLQLAIQSGDRQQAMAAMDRLHALDAEMERLVDRLPPPADGEEEWTAIARHVSDQKLALAFEKLALVSEIGGPDLISQPHPLADLEHAAPAIEHPAIAQPPPLPDWPTLPEVEPAEWHPPRRGVMALVLALLVAVALAAAAVLLTTL